MRETIIIGVVVGAIFFAAGAIVSALAIKYATSSYLWDAILWGGVALMMCSLVTLGLYISSQLGGRPFVLPALLINFGLCLVVGGFVWHFRYGNAPPKPIASPSLKETGRFLLEPGKNKKAFSIDNTNPADLTYKEAPEPEATVKSNNNDPPNVLSVFVHDIKMLDMSGAIIAASVDLDVGQNKFRVFYYTIYNFQANSKYLSVFVSHSPHTFEIVQAIAQGYKNMFDAVERRLGADFQQQGQAGVSRTWELPFSGRINIYTDDQFDPDELGTLSKLFKDNGASPSFFSTDYVLGGWNNIRLGLAAPIGLYELRGNPPEIAPVLPKSTP